MVEIRSYRNQDYPQVREILKLGGLYWEPTDNQNDLMRESLRDPSCYLVAIEDNRIVGTQFVVPKYIGFLFRLAVHPKYQGKGIGTSLRERGELILKERGFHHANILVNSNDEKLITSFEKAGYEKGHTYLWMTKEL